jgi:molybdopterin synthase catalytic subunit
MRVTIRLFAMLRQQAGWREREIELPADSSVERAWRALVRMHPELGAAGETVRFARNGTYASPGDSLSDGDELALIPPVAGGAEREILLRCEIRQQPINDEQLAELRATVPTTTDGALVIFVGQTRESPGTPAPGEEEEAARHAGEAVTALDYEVFEEMALDVLRQVGAEVEQRFGVTRLAIIHRAGRVPLGEASVVIAAAAVHRGAAFDACRYAIDELKARAPIWKEEHFASGSVWIGSPARSGPIAEGGD